MEMFIANTQDLAALSCKAEQSWGVYCSWPPWIATADFESAETWDKRIRGCLPDQFGPSVDQEVILPTECLFLRLFDTEEAARAFYRDCRGESARMPYGGVYAVLMRPDGTFASTNT